MDIYFAQFVPAEEKSGGYCVFFPDLEGCHTCGDDLAESLANAKDCLTSYLSTCLKLGEEIAPPSPLEEAQKKALAYNKELGMPEIEGIFYQAVQPGPLDEKPMQLSISMVPSLVRAIDVAAKGLGMTRSGFLAMAARKCAVETSANI